MNCLFIYIFGHAARLLGIPVPQPGIKPMSLALAGEFLTTAPLGKPTNSFYCGKIHIKFTILSILKCTVQVY